MLAKLLIIVSIVVASIQVIPGFSYTTDDGMKVEILPTTIVTLR